MPSGIYKVIGKMGSGDLRHKIRFLKPNDSFDAGGGHGPGKWSDYDFRWAYIASWSQTEAYKAQQNVVEINQLLAVRFDPLKPIKENMMMELDMGHPFGETSGSASSRRFRVTTVENYEERNIWLIVGGLELKPSEADF